MKNKINKNYLTLFSILLAVVFSFFVGNFAYAGLNEVVAGIVGHFVQFLVWILGGILMVLISILIWIAQYNDFIGSPAVTNGWIIVRDLCNMFFILALLVIAFATILKLENYNIKKMLPKLIIMAILINFSKMICGLIIDFAQVIMLTFVDGFKELGGGQLTQMLGIKDILKLDIGLDEKVTLGSVVGSYILALIYTIISVVVVGVIVAVLVIRMIMLWIYIVLSPLAYLLAAVPGGQKYSSQWWSEFTKNVIIGPVLAFFLWLSFASLGNVTPNNIQKDVLKVESKQLSGIEADLASNITTNKVPNAGVAKAGSRENMIMFIISIGMLMGGLVVTQQIGGLAGKAAGKGMATIQKGQAFVQRTATGAAMLPAKGVGEGIKFGVDKLQEKGIVDLNLKRVWKGMQQKRESRSAARYARGQKAAADVMAQKGTFRGLLAMTAAPGDAWEQIASIKGWKQRIKGGRRMAQKRERIKPELDQAKFEADFVSKTQDEQHDEVMNMGSQLADLKREYRAETDEDKKVQLDSEIKKLENKYNTARKLYNDDVSIDNKDDESIQNIITEKKEKVKNLQKELDKNLPMYSYEARSADNAAVREKAEKIKDVTDADELLRILNQAINEKDKSMIKAITKKMTSNGDENEFLQSIVGDTSAAGLHKFINKLKSEVGFEDQEAKELGSDISMLAKGTKHWSVTGAYKMENGEWREATPEEQANYQFVEASKEHLQSNVRSVNRLGYGYHDEHNNFHINAAGAKMLQMYDFDRGHDEVRKNMQRNAAYMLASDKEGLEKLVKNKVISQELVDAIIERAGSAIEESTEKTHQEIEKALKS